MAKHQKEYRVVKSEDPFVKKMDEVRQEMREKAIEDSKKLQLDGRRFLNLRKQIRKLFDPSCQYLTDEHFDKIIVVTGGVPDRTARRALMKLEELARINRDARTVIRVRDLRLQFEAGVLQLEP